MRLTRRTARETKRLWQRLVCVVALLIGLGSASIWAVSAQSPPADDTRPSATPLEASIRRKIEPALLKDLEAAGDSRIPIIVELTPSVSPPEVAVDVERAERGSLVAAALKRQARASQAGVLAFLDDRVTHGQAQQVRSFWIFNGVAAQTNRETILQLAARPEVRLVRRDAVIRIRDDRWTYSTVSHPAAPTRAVGGNIAQIRADLVWSALRVDGRGVVVASVDTGVDWLHPALRERYRGYDPRGLHRHVCNWFDATGGGATYPVDVFGHGTHTMGTAVGGGGIGVAPGALWITALAFGNDGSALESWLHAAMQWVIDPGPGCVPPDVVINSWGTQSGSTDQFRPDAQALRAAGIGAPFAAGNSGPAASTVGAPAAYPEALAVGAVAPDDRVATFSSRGPSVWYGSNLIKPDLSAPGVNVRSAVPGGSYAEASGTSMATPHIAGVAALMLQADPSLSVEQLEKILTQTTVHLGNPIPNNDYGWGRVDAYAAVATVAQAGTVTGLVKDSRTGRPIAGATVAFTRSDGGSPIIVTTDAGGRYRIGLAPGGYSVAVKAFGYSPATSLLTVPVHQTLARDFALTALPTGTLTGRVTAEGRPIRIGYTIYLPLIGKSATPGRSDSAASATVFSRSARPWPQTVTITVAGTPVQTQTDLSGVFTLTLPAGRYTVTVTSLGHRVTSATDVAVTAGQTTRRDFDLLTAPTILLVDSGAWYYDSQIAYYRQALDDLGYAYDVWTIRDVFRDVPQSRHLAPYDIVIWSSPQDSPGYVGAGEALASYLSGGGALLLSGQDVAYHDDYSLLVYAPYFRRYIQAAFVRENFSVFDVTGATGSPFEGVNVRITGAGGAGNQENPDVIRSINTAHTAPALDYADRTPAGQLIALCTPYRTIFLAFGFEGITSRAGRADLLDRSIRWLTAPRVVAGLEMTPSSAAIVGDFGATVTHTWQIRNIAETGAAERFDLTASGWRWPTRLITQSVTLQPCASTQVALVVQNPAGPPWAASDAVTVTARAATRPDLSVSVVRRTRTPAPLLLVDDDRWYEVGDAYREALRDNGIPFDVWYVQGGSSGGPSRSPPLETLSMYPMVVWFSGYDWYEPLTPEDEAALGHYLDAGGRVAYSGQDYLSASEEISEFAHDRLGVLDYTEDVTNTHVGGVITSPLGSWMRPEELVYPYSNHSDVLTPTVSAAVAFVNQDGQPVALTHARPNWRTAFFAFNPDGLSRSTRVRLLRRLAGWLSWMGASSATVDREYARTGDELAYTVVLHNDGPQALAQAHLTATFTADLMPLPSSGQGGATWDAAHSAFVWSGRLERGQSRRFSYRAAVGVPPTSGRLISHTVWIGYAEHSVLFDRVVPSRVNAPRLDGSMFLVSPTAGQIGDVLTYTLHVHNRGVGTAVLTAINPLPAQLRLLPDSLQVSHGAAAQRGVVPLLDRRVERVHVDVQDAAHLGRPDRAARVIFLQRSCRRGPKPGTPRPHDSAPACTSCHGWPRPTARRCHWLFLSPPYACLVGRPGAQPNRM